MPIINENKITIVPTGQEIIKEINIEKSNLSERPDLLIPILSNKRLH